MKQKTKIILALDVDNEKQALRFVRLLYPKITIFKVGLQLYTACGPKIIKDIRKIGAKVFLDLKFFDIPHTVGNAVRCAVGLKIKMLTLHIQGGEAMLKVAVAAAKQEAKRLKVKQPLLIGVTVLTSQEAKPREVLRLAKLGLGCGLDGVVCSVREAALLRKQIRQKFMIVTPGIRPASAGSDDQKRIATPLAAAKAGSNFLVIGRPILEAKDPLKAVEEIVRSH